MKGVPNVLAWGMSLDLLLHLHHWYRDKCLESPLPHLLQDTAPRLENRDNQFLLHKNFPTNKRNGSCMMTNNLQDPLQAFPEHLVLQLQIQMTPDNHLRNQVWNIVLMALPHNYFPAVGPLPLIQGKILEQVLIFLH